MTLFSCLHPPALGLKNCSSEQKSHLIPRWVEQGKEGELQYLCNDHVHGWEAAEQGAGPWGLPRHREWLVEKKCTLLPSLLPDHSCAEHLNKHLRQPSFHVQTSTR